MRGLVVRVAFASLAVLAVSGCESLQTYQDPAGPGYSGRYATAPRVEPGERPLRVVTYNIEVGRRVSEALVALQAYPPLFFPDALCLQEMDAAGVERIALALGLNYAHYPSGRNLRSGRDYGTAVLSPWPIEDHWKVPLPHKTRIAGRVHSAVAVRLRAGSRSLLVYSFHLGSPLGLSGGRRRDQAEAILADLQAHPGAAVVAGDANSKGIGQVFLEAGFVWPTQHVGGTRGFFSFDHVFARGLALAPPPFAGVVREAKEASDHRPVWALLAWR